MERESTKVWITQKYKKKVETLTEKNDVRPHWNLLNQVLTFAIEGEESPYTASKRSLILLRNFPSKNKNQITDRYCSFSISLKSLDTPASTGSQNKTTNPIQLKFSQ
jgi:hypothetical protein